MTNFKIGEWHPWVGNKQPVPNGTIVSVLLNTGETLNHVKADYQTWKPCIPYNEWVVAFCVNDYPVQEVKIPTPDSFIVINTWGDHGEWQHDLLLKFSSSGRRRDAIKALEDVNND